MATKVTYVSDLSGVEVDSVEKVSLAWNGETVKLEVSPSERQDILDGKISVQTVLDAGRKLKAEKGATPTEVGDDPRAIRASLRAHGHTVSDRGAISEANMAKYAEIKANETAAA